MRSLPPFDSNQPLLRGNLHGHSTHSDGVRNPQEVVETYYQLGYDFIAISDHLWHDTSYAATKVLDASSFDKSDFITLPSAELHCLGKLYDNDGLWHIVANGLPLDFEVAHQDETAPQMIQRALDAGAYVTMAHPEWYSMTTDEAMAISHVHGVEIHNYSCVIGSNRGSGILIADYLLQEGKKVNFTATDDSHFTTPDWAGGWVMVAAELSQQDIVESLKQGRHYSSSGGVFHDIRLDNQTLIIDCAPTQSIMISGAGHTALSQHGHNMTHASFDLSSFNSPWFRVTLFNKDGTRAWSNPYWKDQFTEFS